MSGVSLTSSHSSHPLVAHDALNDDQGEAMNSGHYYAYVKGTDNEWYCMNDSKVTKVHWSVVKEACAYILFYEVPPIGDREEHYPGTEQGPLQSPTSPPMSKSPPKARSLVNEPPLPAPPLRAEETSQPQRPGKEPHAPTTATAAAKKPNTKAKPSRSASDEKLEDATAWCPKGWTVAIIEPTEENKAKKPFVQWRTPDGKRYRSLGWAVSSMHGRPRSSHGVPELTTTPWFFACKSLSAVRSRCATTVRRQRGLTRGII